MGARFWRVQASQNHQKSQKNRSQGHVEKNNDFQTSFSVILEHFGDPIWGLGTLILGQRGGARQSDALLREIMRVFVVF